jgi:RimJ/RimL family protein N-acetyltransferase
MRLQNGNLLLQIISSDDALDVFRHSLEPDYRQWLPSQLYASVEAAESALVYLHTQFEENGDPRLAPCVFAIRLESSKEFVGHVGLSPFNGNVEIGFAIVSACQRRGFAQQAIRLASDWAFGAFSLSRIMAYTAHANRASRQTLSRAGYSWTNDLEMLFQGKSQSVSVYQLNHRQP